MAEVLLFDLGGVLVDFAGFRELSSLIPETLEHDEMRRRWLSSETVRDFELGASSNEEFAAAFVPSGHSEQAPVSSSRSSGHGPERCCRARRTCWIA